MKSVEPIDSTADIVVVMHSVPGFRHYTSHRARCMAAMPRSCWIWRWGLRRRAMLPAGTGYTTLEFKISFIRGMTKVPEFTEGRSGSMSAAAPPPPRRAL